MRPTRTKPLQEDEEIEYVDISMSTSVPSAKRTGTLTRATPHQEDEELEYVDNPTSLSLPGEYTHHHLSSRAHTIVTVEDEEEEQVDFGNDPPWSGEYRYKCQAAHDKLTRQQMFSTISTMKREDASCSTEASRERGRSCSRQTI